MNLINLTTSAYPASLWQVRQDNPNVSFPAMPSDEDLAPFGYANVHPTPQPTCDHRIERIEEAAPAVDAYGTWQQVWNLRAATAEEIAGYDAQFVAAPDWQGAFQALVQELLPPERYQDVAAQFNLPLDSHSSAQQ